MGQKVNPNSFRLGFFKKHNVTWFSGYRTFSQVLKEDYKIRKFFEFFFGSLHNKAGLTSVEIKRTLNDIEFKIHTARPKTLRAYKNQNNLIKELQTNFKLRTNTSKKISIKFLQTRQSVNESSLVARSIADQIEKRITFRRAINQTVRMLEKNRVDGFKIQLSGRLNGAELARRERVHNGRLPLQTMRSHISYTYHTAKTAYGLLGIKVWIFNKKFI